MTTTSLDLGKSYTKVHYTSWLGLFSARLKVLETGLHAWWAKLLATLLPGGAPSHC